MAFRLLCISFISVILLSASIDASRYRSLRHKRADQCIDTNIDGCLFVTCENGGTCSQDLTTVDCFRCQCTLGYTGKVCDTPIAIIPAGCSPGCQNGGACIGNVCLCSAGYTGVFCETRDFCVPINPCQNGGRCTSIGANYVCDCTGTGYTGTVCNEVISIDPCASSPCQNGGQCSWNGATINCLCFNGYTGPLCQIAPVPCAAAPCENGGTCELVATNTYGCVCPAEFTGTRCENFILANHPCITMPSSVCQNGGTCTVNGADYLCNCATGWSGPNCQTPGTISSCNPSPCGVHGSCVEAILPTETVAYCNCESQWTGKYCDVNMNVNCPVGYCLSGGVCRMNGNVPYCECPALYTGQQCEIFIGAMTTTLGPVVTPCSPNPCQNGGTCFKNGYAFVCACQPVWTGSRCEYSQTVIVPTTMTPSVGITCANQPCKNGGTCYSINNSYYCQCANVYTGINCETIPAINCPLNCAPGYCVPSGGSVIPYVCICDGTMKLTSCTSK